MKKTLQTKIAINDSYDTRLCYTHTVQCHTDHSLQCWSQFYQNVCYYRYMHISLIFHKVMQKRIYRVVGYIIITLLQTVRKVCQLRKFEIWSIIDTKKSKMACFYGSRCRLMQCIQRAIVIATGRYLTTVLNQPVAATIAPCILCINALFSFITLINFSIFYTLRTEKSNPLDIVQ